MVAEEVKTISDLAQLGAGIAIGFGASAQELALVSQQKG